LMSLFFLLFGMGVVLVSAVRAGQIEAECTTCGEKVIALVGEDESAFAKASADEGVEKVGEVVEAEELVDYYLAYPGILPDHPLYWLKMIRDKISLSLTRDPEARFERLLLYADKRVGAAEVLIKGGKSELGVTTATKSEKYLSQAVDQFKQLEEVSPEMKKRMRGAVLKHKEVLSGVLDQIPDQARGALVKSIENVTQNLEKIKS
jgi:hypothetical protein